MRLNNKSKKVNIDSTSVCLLLIMVINGLLTEMKIPSRSNSTLFHGLALKKYLNDYSLTSIGTLISI